MRLYMVSNKRFTTLLEAAYQKIRDRFELIAKLCYTLTVPVLIPKYFCAVYDLREKQILARATEIQKENWG